MPTRVELVDREELVRFDPELEPHQFEIRRVFMLPRVPEQIGSLVAAAELRFGEINYFANCLRPTDVTAIKTADDAGGQQSFKGAPYEWQRAVSVLVSP